MLTIIHIAAIFFFLLPGITVRAADEAVLEQMTRTDERENVQLVFTFSKIPDYEVNTTGKRIDLFLPATRLRPDLPMIATDDRIIKVLSETRSDGLKLSFFLRYPPQDIDSTEITGSKRILLDILLGNPLSKHYPNLASEVSGISVMKGKLPDLTNPAAISRYRGKWRTFFSEYETPIPIDIPPRFTLPPFPVSQCFSMLRTDQEFLPPEAKKPVADQAWDEVQSILRETLREHYGVKLEGDTEEEKKEEEAPKETVKEDETTAANRRLVTLAYADALVRSDDYRQAWRVLNYVDTLYPEITPTEFTGFLRTYLQAVHDDPYLASLELGNMETQLSREPLLIPYVTLLQAELALAAHRPDRAEQFLSRDDAAYDTRAARLRLIHRADTYYQQGKRLKALVIYRMAAAKYDLSDMPASMANFADILYEHHHHREAAALYKKLAEQLTGAKQQDKVLYKLAMCELKYRDPKKVILSFLQIEEGFPGTRGAAQAHVKQIDINYLSGRIGAKTTAERYGETAVTGKWREIREEAAFKQILVLHLAGEEQRAMDLLQVFMRDFRAGKLLTEARALTIEVLPTVIRGLIGDGKYLQALILAQKNQLFFVRHWVDNSVLTELAQAYLELGFFDQAEQVYRYMLEIADEKELEELYIKLLVTLEDGEKYDLIGDYADRFRYRFPKSKHLDQVFLIHLRALRKNEKLKDAARLLALESRPSSPEIEKIGSAILFQLKRYDEVLKILTPLEERFKDDPEVLYRLAESAFQTGDYARARPLFEKLAQAGEEWQDQARYRLARMDIAENHPNQALDLLKQVAKTGTNPLWKKLAREEAAIMELETEKL